MRSALFQRKPDCGGNAAVPSWSAWTSIQYHRACGEEGDEVVGRETCVGRGQKLPPFRAGGVRILRRGIYRVPGEDHRPGACKWGLVEKSGAWARHRTRSTLGERKERRHRRQPGKSTIRRDHLVLEDGPAANGDWPGERPGAEQWLTPGADFGWGWRSPDDVHARAAAGGQPQGSGARRLARQGFPQGAATWRAAVLLMITSCPGEGAVDKSAQTNLRYSESCAECWRTAGRCASRPAQRGLRVY